MCNPLTLTLRSGSVVWDSEANTLNPTLLLGPPWTFPPQFKPNPDAQFPVLIWVMLKDAICKGKITTFCKSSGRKKVMKWKNKRWIWDTIFYELETTKENVQLWISGFVCSIWFIVSDKFGRNHIQFLQRMD